MTALADALEASGHLPPMPGTYHRIADRTDPQLSNAFWNHTCPVTGCSTWVPNHRYRCTRHDRETT